MGFSRPYTTKELGDMAAADAAELRIKRLSLSNKITMVVIDKIVMDLIRPGPKPEERECYEVAQELRDMSDEIKQLIVDVLSAENVEP